MTQPLPLRRMRNRLWPITLVGVLLLALAAGGSWALAAVPDLSVSTSDSVDAVNPGDTLSYRVTIKNRSTTRSLTVASVTNTLDPDVEFQEASDAGSYSSSTRTITWSGPISLAPGRQTFRYVTVNVASPLAAGTEIGNNAAAQEAGNPAPAPITAVADVDTVLNVVPDAVDASEQTDEDTALPLDLRSYVTDANGDAVSFTITTQPTRGTLTHNNGQVVYTPDANASYTDSFTYSVTDGSGDGADTATVTITVNPVNDRPVPGSDSGTTNEDTALTFEAAALLENDRDIDGGTLRITGVQASTSAGGTATFNSAANTITYQPPANFNGSDTLTYIVGDGNPGGTANGTVTITVNAVNDAPSFTAGADVTVAEDAGSQEVPGWASNISAGPADESGQVLDFQVLNDNPALFAAEGAPALNANGTLTFTSATNAFGTATVTVRLHDNGGTLNGGVDTSAEQTFTITFGPMPDPPFADNEDVSTPAGTPITIAVLEGDSDPDGDSLFVVAVTQPANGAATFNGNTVTFTPDTGFVGTTSFTYTISDGTGRTATGRVTVTVTRVNRTPTARNHTHTINEDNVLSVDAPGLLGGAADPDGDTLFVDANSVTNPSRGRLVWYTNGSFSYQPHANFNGTDSFAFRVTDGTASSDLHTVTITINPVNDPPAITPGLPVTVPEDFGAYVGGWFTSQVAGPADESAQTVMRTLANSNTALFAVQPTLADDGTLRFTPAPDAFGSSTVTIELHDDGGTANGGVDRATFPLLITVSAVNDAPSFAKGADITVAEDSGPFTAAWATEMSSGPANEANQSLTFSLAANNASLFAVQPAVAANGTLTFTPAPHANGSTSVRVTLRDSGGTANNGRNTAVANFTLTITPVADAPVAEPDTTSAATNATISIGTAALLRNDHDPDGDPLTVTGVSASSSAGGTVVHVGDTVSYTSARDFVGNDTFTYSVSDGTGNTATGTVTIRVTASGSHLIYVPAVMNGGSATSPPPTPAPATADLVGSFTLSPAKTSFSTTEHVLVTATVTNQGTAAAGAFWVDFYLNPSAAPTATNVAWNTVCTLKPCQGIAWYVKDGLAPGQSITLTSTSASYMSGYTIWSGQFTAGTSNLYLYVDSWNPGVATGGVAESNENNNRAELHSLVVAGATVQSADVPDPAELPRRPFNPSR